MRLVLTSPLLCIQKAASMAVTAVKIYVQQIQSSMLEIVVEIQIVAVVVHVIKL
ncbi:hypothetical protein NST41_32670 [Paenibacillus sp. FSL L8-0696]|uniref:hypothetical protein n=1 Tax=Paenibacillus sp. FSL L8-0696 TaxID=2954524 RepID=UPI0031191E2C